MKKIVLVLCAVVIALFVSTPSWAAFTCDGKVNTLALEPQNGFLWLSTGYGVHFLCNVASIQNNVDPAMCRTLYTMLMAAKLSGKTIRQHYDHAGTSGKSCSTLGSWSAPDPLPYFVEILD